MQVFLSWSGEHSRLAASALRDWLPLIVPTAKPWMSEHDIVAGKGWSRSIATALMNARYGIIVLTPENLRAAWVLFEAGALSRTMKSEIVPYLIDVEYSDLPGPLTQFQAARGDRDGTLKLVQSLNAASDTPLTRVALKRRFDREFIVFERSLRQISRRAIQPRRSADGVYTATSREATYARAVEVIRRVEKEQKGIKSLLLAALHGHRRLSAGTTTNAQLRAFDVAMKDCARSSGPDMWSVREIYNITSTQRLDEVLRMITRAADADGYQVKAICVPNALPPLAPLVIGKRDLLVGFDDPRYYRVGGAIHIESDAAVAIAERHFEGLWADPDCVTIKSAIGIEKSGVAQVRRNLRRLAADRVA